MVSFSVVLILAYAAKPSWIPRLVSFAVGALLGAVFLEILPHAFDQHAAPVALSALSFSPRHGATLASHQHDAMLHVSATLMFGILFFFLLEKLVLWRHCHEEGCDEHSAHSHSHDHGRSGLMILIGDTFHNFLDGALIASAFMADIQVGIATSLAIVSHEIPQEAGDYLVLLHSGFSRRKALLLNLASMLATLAGGLLAYWWLAEIKTLQPYLLALAASSMLYVAIADLIPGLHRRPHLYDTLQQMSLIAAGMAAIWFGSTIFPH